MKKAGLIGFGKIGQYLYNHLKEKYNISFIFDLNCPEDTEAARIYLSTKEEVFVACRDVHLVIEAAAPEILKEMAPEILRHTEMTGFSLTAFSDDEFLNQVKTVCAKNGHHFYVPHGAIAGLDGVFDGRSIIQSVRITTTKKPENLGRTDTTRTVIYEGPTGGACTLFPRDVNGHAGLALAGIGFDETISRIVSDPDALGNTHDIEVVADGCTFKMNILSTTGSGVTSAYTPVSALSSVDKILTKSYMVIA